MKIKKILELFRPENANPSQPEYEITNAILYDALIADFKTQMNKLSVKRRVLYPMSFNILMCPDDYEKVGESLPFILPEVVAGFYGAIKEKSKGINDVDYTSPATYWFFQFAASKVKTVGDKDDFIKPGEFVINGNLKAFDIRNAGQNSIEQNTRLSIKCHNSNVNQTNINRESLVGMEILTNNAFSFRFDKNMSQSTKDIQSSQRDNNNSLATISYTTKDNLTATMSMLDDLITISGPAETRKGANIIKIDNEAVQIGHVQIHYIRETNKFKICAYAKTRLNMSNMEISTGGAPIWKDLSYKSDIFLNDEINIKFKAADSVINQS